MHKDGKVVPITASIEQAHSAPLARLPVVLLQVRDKAALHLRQGLQALFDNADDTLFEMADKAASNSEQNYLFEAMRDLRLKRKNIERGYLDRFYQAFVRLSQTDPMPLAPPGSGYDKLVLVANDELERTVALDAMVARVLARDGFALNQLTLRFAALTRQALDDRSNPLGPAMLCEYFLQAGRNLGVGIKVKLIILKLFERYVLQDADQLYGEANQLLVATGILPELKSVPRRRVEDRSASSRSDPANQEGDERLGATLDANEQAVFSALQCLLSRVRGRVAPRLEAGNAVQPISTRDLLRLLSHLQHYVPPTPQVDDFDLHQQLEQLLTRVSVKSGTYRKVEGVDEDVINLIGMLFDFILVDHNLPHSLRVLIGRMQIPLLKVAVLDKRFFSRSSHPARRLLNEIATAAMGWDAGDDCQRDALYPRVEKIVQRLLSDFVDDPAIFSDLLAEFLAFNSDERRRNELLEQRTRDAEEGRARAQLARQRVQQELNRRLLGKTLPRVVVRLLEEAWSQVLLLACLKHGDSSAQWVGGLETMDTLIWSVEPHDEDDAAQRLLAVVPGLLKALREGLASAAFDPFATSEFFAQLEALHVQAFDAPFTRHGEAIERVLVLDEIVLANPEHPAPAHGLVHLADDDPALLQVQRLRIGSWVELTEDGDVQRCKLIAQIDSTDRFIFVNRTGMKVRDYSRMALAVALGRGDVRPLDDTLLFDRALDSVVSQLRLAQAR
ncbi:DUF1631 domain-containing protein [Pseudomonas sp. GD03860]|uniref:DUF1631 domain-containing protein n=1 Tax=Pseudomonas TaxID=286 RepID=UPI0023633305|nr:MULTISPECIES: DUF1631 domain-containing protein [Pseudomonas]MDD2060647.1 DUF1631 domain-containing protein [Pseudomonas putida]MDH0637777.1 DUF1631 domain-containing protein [Pseudomonas sp. GD03860]